MAGPVKGTIGGDDVTLIDAATETTLLKILAAMKKQGGGGGGGGKGGAQSSEEELMEIEAEEAFDEWESSLTSKTIH